MTTSNQSAPSAEKYSRMMLEVVRKKNEKDDKKYDVVVVCRANHFVAVGEDLLQIGLSQVFRLEALRRSSASKYPLDLGNDMQVSQLLPLRRHSLQHLRRPRSSTETFHARVPARATSIPPTSTTSLLQNEIQHRFPRPSLVSQPVKKKYKELSSYDRSSRRAGRIRWRIDRLHSRTGRQVRKS